jgi:HPt (histidine-containing phosphotransfer) domain-containing protein
MSTLRVLIGEFTLDELLSKREIIANRMEDILDTFSLPLGIDVTRIDITDVVIPTDMQRAIAREAEAQRERRARLRRAEGEVEAVKNLAHAAHTMAKNPELLELRRLQTVGELGMEQHTLITLVLPYDYGKLGGVGKGRKLYSTEDNTAFLESIQVLEADDLLESDANLQAEDETEGESDADAESVPAQAAEEAPAAPEMAPPPPAVDDLPAAPDFGDQE